MNIRVVIADDHPQVRSAVAGLLEEIAAVELVGSAVDGEDAVRLVAALQPDLLFLDLIMPRLSGFAALPRVREAHPELRVVILSMHCSEEYVRRALELGAVGFMRKDTVTEELEQAIAKVMDGEVWLSPALSQSALAAYARRNALDSATHTTRSTSSTTSPTASIDACDHQAALRDGEKNSGTDSGIS